MQIESETGGSLIGSRVINTNVKRKGYRHTTMPSSSFVRDQKAKLAQLRARHSVGAVGGGGGGVGASVGDSVGGGICNISGGGVSVGAADIGMHIGAKKHTSGGSTTTATRTGTATNTKTTATTTAKNHR
jgi:hypothetical protein